MERTCGTRNTALPPPFLGSRLTGPAAPPPAHRPSSWGHRGLPQKWPFASQASHGARGPGAGLASSSRCPRGRGPESRLGATAASAAWCGAVAWAPAAPEGQCPGPSPLPSGPPSPQEPELSRLGRGGEAGQPLSGPRLLTRKVQAPNHLHSPEPTPGTWAELALCHLLPRVRGTGSKVVPRQRRWDPTEGDQGSAPHWLCRQTSCSAQDSVSPICKIRAGTISKTGRDPVPLEATRPQGPETAPPLPALGCGPPPGAAASPGPRTAHSPGVPPAASAAPPPAGPSWPGRRPPPPLPGASLWGEQGGRLAPRSRARGRTPPTAPARKPSAWHQEGGAEAPAL